MVIGRVGCGKSTFLSALNRFVPNVAGDFSVSGRVAYVAQQAWILNSTIRENILFGKPYDAAKYARCVKASQLQTDFEILPGGDGTIIGERGVTLSGGQKQRVAIARAVYAAADVYLMDDPLSAVDNHVGAALFDQVLSHDGALWNATRVLATNALHFLPKADRVVVIEDGRVAEMGTYNELMSKGLNFASLMAAHGIENEEEGDKERGNAKRGPSVDLKRGPSMDGKRAPSVDGKPAEPAPAPKKGEMGAEEQRAVGNVGAAVYLALFNATGSKLTIPVVVLLFGVEYGSKAFLDFWLSWWAGDEWGWESNQYLGVYFGIFLLNGMAIFFRSLIIYFFLVRAANNLHKGLLNRVMKFPM